VHLPDADLPLSCVTCEVVITGKPIFQAGLPFCCSGCVAGRECTCSIAVQGNARVRHCHDVLDPPTPSRMTRSSRDLALSRR
jgi:hypothetical protein